METPENDVGFGQINPSRQRVWRRSSGHRRKQVSIATLMLSGIPHNRFFTKRAVLALLGSNWTCISPRGINGNQTSSGRTHPWRYDTAAESELTTVAISLKIIFFIVFMIYGRGATGGRICLVYESRGSKVVMRKTPQDLYILFVTIGSDHVMYLAMKGIHTLFVSKGIFRNSSLDVDALQRPGGSYRFEDIRGLFLRLIDKADLHIVGDHVAIDFPDAPRPNEEASGQPRKKQESNIADRLDVSAAAIQDGTCDLIRKEASFPLSRAITRMVVERTGSDPRRAIAVIDALELGPADAPVVLDLAFHLTDCSESLDAGMALMRRARELSPDDDPVHAMFSSQISDIHRLLDWIIGIIQEWPTSCCEEPRDLREVATHG